MSEIKFNLNEKIVKYLDEKSISQTKLAKLTGISQQNLNRVLNSDDIKVSQLHIITKALKLPITYFFDGKENVTNEEIQGYKEKIQLLEDLISREKRLKFERYIDEVNNILRYDFAYLPEGTKDKLRTHMVEGINEFNSIINSMVNSMYFEISKLTKDEIRNTINEKLLDLNKEKVSKNKN